MKKVIIFAIVCLCFLPAAGLAQAPEIDSYTRPQTHMLTSTSAVLKVSFTSNTDSVTCYFEWGPTTSYGNRTAIQKIDKPGYRYWHCLERVTGLTPNATYHYRIVLQNSAGQTQGADASFTTPPMPTDERLDARTTAASNVTSTSATLKGQVNSQGSKLWFYFEYGPTTTYGKKTMRTPLGTDVNVVANIKDLTPNTTYHYRIVVESDVSGYSKRAAGSSFKTPRAQSAGGVCYRAYVQGHGWMPEACNGAVAGTTGKKLRMEAIQIWSTTSGVSVCYKAHLQGKGWTPEVCDRATAGTTGESRRLEALQIRLKDSKGEKIIYQGHVQDRGWQKEVTGGTNAFAGTTGENRRLEAVRIRLQP